jgi:hypothetical protein
MRFAFSPELIQEIMKKIIILFTDDTLRLLEHFVWEMELF